MKSEYLLEGAITTDVITDLMLKMAEKTDCGGHSAFFGQVRADKIDSRRVKAIEYSAYESMVKAEADKIREEILVDFGDARSVEIVHSHGVVRAGELSLFVLVSAGHRQHAIEACSRCVELIKERLPVWKKEIFDDESHIWKDNSSGQTAS
jgi:molybdopterin synthase catalytic subunit